MSSSNLTLTELSQSEYDNAIAVRGVLGHKHTDVGVVPAMIDGTRVVVYTVPHPQEAQYEVPVAIVLANNPDLFHRLVPAEGDVTLVDDREER
jgi:hypothetical protein